MKIVTITVALCATAALSACAETAGESATSPVFGSALRASFAAQEAYAGSDQRLRDLSDEFRAETDEVVTFAFDKATLDQTARTALESQAEWLRQNPQVRMTIMGHTDLVGSERYNYGLGLRRAKSALEYLVSHGVSRDRLEAIESFGETEPVVATERRERRNRRAVTMVEGFAAGYVGDGLDGVYAQRIYDRYQAGQVEVREAESTEDVSN